MASISSWRGCCSKTLRENIWAITWRSTSPRTFWSLSFFFREHHPRLDHWLSRNCAIHSGTYVFESRAAGRGNTRAEHELSCFTDLWSVVISSHLCVRQHRALRQLHARFLALGCRISGLSSLAPQERKESGFLGASCHLWRDCLGGCARCSSVGYRKHAGLCCCLCLGRALASA